MRWDPVRWTVIIGLLTVLAMIAVPFIEHALRASDAPDAHESSATSSELPAGSSDTEPAKQPEAPPQLTEEQRLAASQAAFESCVADGPDQIRRSLQSLRVGVLYCWAWQELPFQMPSARSRSRGAHLGRAIRVSASSAEVLTDRLCALTMDSDEFVPGVDRTGQSFDEGATVAIIACRAYATGVQMLDGDSGGESFDVLISDGARRWRFALECQCSGYHALRIDNAAFDTASRRLTLSGTTTAGEMSAGGRRLVIQGSGDRRPFRLAVTFAPNGTASVELV